MRRVYAEVTVKVVIRYENVHSLMGAIASIEKGFGTGESSSEGYEWKTLTSRKPQVEVLP